MARCSAPSIGRRYALRILLLALAAAAASPAAAKVEIAFYSRDGDGRRFPHAFVTLHGTNANGRRIDTAIGFTSVSVTPAILTHYVPGRLEREPPPLVARSIRQFSLTLDDRRYRAVDRAIRRWGRARQPSYSFEHRNCVHFVGDLAHAAGLRVRFERRLMKDPKAFLLAVKAANPALSRMDAGALPESEKPLTLHR